VINIKKIHIKIIKTTKMMIIIKEIMINTIKMINSIIMIKVFLIILNSKKTLTETNIKIWKEQQK